MSDEVSADGQQLTFGVALVETDAERLQEIARQLGEPLEAECFASLGALQLELAPGAPVVVVLGPSYGNSAELERVEWLTRTWPDLGLILVVEELSTTVRPAVRRRGGDAQGQPRAQHRRRRRRRCSSRPSAAAEPDGAPRRIELMVLPAPTEPALAEKIAADDVRRIIEVLRSFCQHIVIDTPAHFDDVVLALLDESDEIVLVSAMEVPGVKNLKLAVQTLRQLDMPVSKLKLVLVRSNTKIQMDVRDIERALSMKTAVVIPQ